MMLFLVIWILLIAAAGGLAVGTLWGRELRKGSCGGGTEAGEAVFGCEGCTSRETSRCRASRAGG